MTSAQPEPPSLLADALALVPTHRQPHQSPQALAGAIVAATAGLSLKEALTAVHTTLGWLSMFGALHWEGGGVRTSGQVATYFIHSLTWYARHELAVTVDPRADASQAGAGDGALRLPVLLRHMDMRRVQLAQALHVPAEPSREQAAVLILFKKQVRGKSCLLFQWDGRAKQYQLIGGRIEPGETPHAAAVRECVEEIGGRQPRPWECPRDFTLSPLSLRSNMPHVELTAISPTYGALTGYRFFLFHARLTSPIVSLAEGDCWIPIDRVQSGGDAQRRLGDGELYRALDEGLVGGLSGLPSSVTSRP